MKINPANGNLEILAKLMNSVATKYGCSVKYDRKFKRLNFSGDPSHRLAIAHELVYLFEGK